ncbi:hypothetical protein ACCS91_39405, partial [Rhizobium ruizarguesonis]
RYTGAAFTSDLAWLIGAGFAPLVALSLSIRFGPKTTACMVSNAGPCIQVRLFPLFQRPAEGEGRKRADGARQQVVADEGQAE